MDNKRHHHGSFTFKVESADNGSFVASIVHETKRQEPDDVGALYYVVVVIMIYACSILMMIASYIRKNKMDRKLNRYLKDMAFVRKRECQFQMLMAAKKAAAVQESLTMQGTAAGGRAGDGDGDVDHGGNGERRDGSVAKVRVVTTTLNTDFEDSDKLSACSGTSGSGHRRMLESQDHFHRIQVMCQPQILTSDDTQSDQPAEEEEEEEDYDYRTLTRDRIATADQDDVAKLDDESSRSPHCLKPDMDRLEIVVDDVSGATETTSECSYIGSLLSPDDDDSVTMSYSGVQIVSSV